MNVQETACRVLGWHPHTVVVSFLALCPLAEFWMGLKVLST